MKLNLVINSLGANDLKEIQNYYNNISISFGNKIIKNILFSIENLIVFPKMGKLLSKKFHFKNQKYRYLIINNFIVFYIYKNNSIFIERIIPFKKNYKYLFYEYID